MTVIAEGIETFEELAYLQGATRIRYGQGFYFAKPFFLEDHAKAKRVLRDEQVSQAGREHAGHSRESVGTVRLDSRATARFATLIADGQANATAAWAAAASSANP